MGHRIKNNHRRYNIIWYIYIVAISFCIADTNYILSDYQFTNNFFAQNKYVKYFQKWLQTDEIEYIVIESKKQEINPLLIFAIGQKEISFFSEYPRRAKTNYWLGCALHSDKKNGQVGRNQSFNQQILLALYCLREHFNNAKKEKYQIYLQYEKRTITADNAATYALYKYTPIYYWKGRAGWESNTFGNYIFKDIYDRFYNNLTNK